MAGTSTRIRLLFLIVLCFSYIICNNGAIPFTRSRNLMKEPQSYEVAKVEKIVKNWKTDSRIFRRMEIEVNDYPGSGANNRHTPRSQAGRSCTIDC
ncbi:hypothetical protein ABFS83_09G038300 [Erythranthe nasuta]